MSGPVFVVAPEVGVSYLTSGKRYHVSSDDGVGFNITDDQGDLIFCLWDGCAHLDGDDWQRVGSDDGEPIAKAEGR